MKKFTQHFSGTSEQAYENKLVPAISLAGEINDVAKIDGTDAGTYYVYKGIEGSAICRGGGCKINDDDTFSANWYFVPIRDTEEYDLSDAYFIETTSSDGEKSFTQALYAEYGLWLEKDSSDLMLNRVAGVGRGSVASATKRVDLTTGDDSSATYTGSASGLSYLKETDADDNTVSKSGQFTANVELTATFGSENAELAGKVDEFRGSAVNSDDWEISFEDVRIDVSDPKFEHGAVDGEAFRAFAFGEANQRPSGFYGDFFKHFIDGRAAESMPQPGIVLTQFCCAFNLEGGGFAALFCETVCRVQVTPFRLQTVIAG